MTERNRADITQVLTDESIPPADMSERLLPVVYEELRALAQRYMNAERKDHTLQPTALVHEAFLKLTRTERRVPWANRAHFYLAAAQAMRQILLDHAEAKRALKRGGGRKREPLNLGEVAESWDSEETQNLDRTILRLIEVDPGIGDVVRLRFFAGLTIDQTAEVLGISRSTVKRRWEVGRIWIHRELKSGSDDHGQAEGSAESGG